jgi:ketosteroid isomerase-like protein
MSAMPAPEDVVRAWIEAVNAGDIDRVGELVADDVAILGPRGETTGRDAVASWIGYTGILIELADVRIEEGRATIETLATWQVDGGEPGERTPEAAIGMAFTIRSGKITSIERI